MTISLRRLFRISSVVIVVMGIALGAYLWWLDQELNDATKRMSTASRNVAFAQRLQTDLLAHRSNLLLADLSERDHDWSEVRVIGDLLREDATWLRQFAADPIRHPHLAKLQDSIDDYLDTQNRLQRTKFTELERFNRAAPEFEKAIHAANVVVQSNTDEQSALQKEIVARSDLAKWLGVVIGFVVLVAIVLLLAALNRFLFKPLTNLNRAIRKVSTTGQVDVAVPTTGARDIREIAESFNDMTTRLKEQEELRARVIASIAHDIRSPLGAMQMSLELMTEEEEPSLEERQTYLGILKRQMQGLLTLASDLTETAAIHGGNLKLERGPLDFVGLVAQAVSFFGHASRHHQIVFESEEASATVLADPTRLSQVLNNLIGNAIKYSPNGGTIGIRIWNEGKAVKVSIRDSGLGIPPNELKTIFEPFKRSTRTKNRVPGLGLGLATSLKIIHAHGGEIHVESEAGRGSTFTIELPLAEASAEISASPSV